VHRELFAKNKGSEDHATIAGSFKKVFEEIKDVQGNDLVEETEM